MRISRVLPFNVEFRYLPTWGVLVVVLVVVLIVVLVVFVVLVVVWVVLGVVFLAPVAVVACHYFYQS